MSDHIAKERKTWFQLLDSLLEIFLARWYFENSVTVSSQDKEIYQPHGLLNALNCLYGSVVYLLRLLNGIAKISIAFGRSKMVLRHHKLGLLHVRSRWWL